METWHTFSHDEKYPGTIRQVKELGEKQRSKELNNSQQTAIGFEESRPQQC